MGTSTVGMLRPSFMSHPSQISLLTRAYEHWFPAAALFDPRRSVRANAFLKFVEERAEPGSELALFCQHWAEHFDPDVHEISLRSDAAGVELFIDFVSSTWDESGREDGLAIWREATLHL